MAVTVYTLPDCIQCEMTKKLLDRSNITYSSIDMSQDEDAKKIVEDLGYKQAPVVVYDKFNWSGFRPDKINALHLLLLEKGINKIG
jgi:glutaredoxin-like protein NrdH